MQDLTSKNYAQAEKKQTIKSAKYVTLAVDQNAWYAHDLPIARADYHVLVPVQLQEKARGMG